MSKSLLHHSVAGVMVLTAGLFTAPAALAQNPGGRVADMLDNAHISLHDAVADAMALQPGMSVAQVRFGLYNTQTDWAVAMTDGANLDISRYSMADGSQIFDHVTPIAPRSRREQVWITASQSPITVLNAIDLASAQIAGNRTYEVRYASLTDGNTVEPVWEARVLAADNLLVRYDIDATTGAVLYSTVIDNGRRAEVNICNVQLPDALAIASQAVPDGVNLGAKFIARNARIYWSVWTQEGDQIMAVQINPLNGDVVSVSPATVNGRSSSQLAGALAAGLPVSMSQAVDIARQTVGSGYSYYVMAVGKPDHITYKVHVLVGTHEVHSEMVDSLTGGVTQN